MNLPTETFGDVIVIHTPEELGADHCDGFSAFVSSVDRKLVVLDLDGTEMLDSQGLAALLEAQDQVREQGGEAKISTNNPVNRKILEITRLDQHFEVFESVVEAVKSFL
jgi:anti-sigma B factor antagonist